MKCAHPNWDSRPCPSEHDIDKEDKGSMASEDHEHNDNALFVLHIGRPDPGRYVASHRVNRRGAGDG